MLVFKFYVACSQHRNSEIVRMKIVHLQKTRIYTSSVIKIAVCCVDAPG